MKKVKEKIYIGDYDKPFTKINYDKYNEILYDEANNNAILFKCNDKENYKGYKSVLEKFDEYHLKEMGCKCEYKNFAMIIEYTKSDVILFMYSMHNLPFGIYGVNPSFKQIYEEILDIGPRNQCLGLMNLYPRT